MKTIRPLLILFVFSVQLSAQSMKESLNLSERERFIQSNEMYKALISKSESKFVEPHYFIGDNYYKNEQYDSAQSWYSIGMKINENSPFPYIGMGKVTMGANPTEGKANFDKAVSLAKKDGRVYGYIAEYFLTAEKPNIPKALEYALKGTEIDPKNAMPKLILGDAYFANNDGSRAMEQYKAALVLNNSSPLPLWKMGKLFLAAKNYELGLQYFKDGLVIDAEFAPIYREMGELYYRAKKFDKAIESYKQYLQIRDKSDETDFRYASFLFLNEDYKNALTILDNLAKKGFSNPVLFRLLGFSQFETKEYSSALKNMDIFWSKIQSKKIIIQDYEYYGKILAKNGQDSLAADFFYRALDKDSTKIEFYGEIASVWFASKKYDKAAEAYKVKLAKLEPISKPASLANDYLSLGRSYLYNQKFVSADSAFAKLTEVRPDLPLGFMFRARTNAYLDPQQEKALAKPYYEKFIELAKEDTEKNKKDLVEAYSYLGSYYLLVSKEKAKADEAWKNVRTLDPSNKAATEAAKLK